MTSLELLEKLEQARLNRGLNITEFAALLGISYDTYYKWKRGETPKTIAAIIKTFNLCIEEDIL